MEQYIPWLISGGSLLVAILTFSRNGKKDENAMFENFIKVNLKLDTLCQNITEIRSDIKSTANRVGELEKDIIALQRDMKTAFNQIDELKGERQ